jgi:hypothetical protein
MVGEFGRPHSAKPRARRGRPRVRCFQKGYRAVLRAPLVVQPENPDDQPRRSSTRKTAYCMSVCADVFDMSAENAKTSGSGRILDRGPGSDLPIYKRVYIAAPVADVFDHLMTHQATLVPVLPTAYGWSLAPRIIAAIRPHQLVLLWNWRLPSGFVGSSRISLRLFEFDNGTWLELEHVP